MTAEEITTFRTNFPEFSDDDTYSDSMITFWSGIAESRLNEVRWGDLLTHGIDLMTAHYLTIARKNAIAGQVGRVPGEASGVITNKSVGGVNIGYDTSSVALENAGNFNLSTYGREFWQLAKIVGIGGLQL